MKIHMHAFPPPPIPIEAPEPYRQFWRLWREEQFFECHEVLEDLWRETKGPHAVFLNGLIHCAVSLYQERRGNNWGASRQLVRAQVKLGPFCPRYYLLEVNELLAWLQCELQPSLRALSTGQQKQLATLRDQVGRRVALRMAEEG